MMFWKKVRKETRVSDSFLELHHLEPSLRQLELITQLAQDFGRGPLPSPRSYIRAGP